MLYLPALETRRRLITICDLCTVQVILDDIALLGLKPDVYSYTSDHFDTLQSLCERMIRERKAFADDTDPETMKKEREERADSKNRNNCENPLTSSCSLIYNYVLIYLFILHTQYHRYQSKNHLAFPSVLWHCWLGDRKGIQPVKGLGVGLLVVMIWLELCTTYSSSYHHHFHHPLLQLTPANPGSPGKWPLKWREIHIKRRRN